MSEEPIPYVGLPPIDRSSAPTRYLIALSRFVTNMSIDLDIPEEAAIFIMKRTLTSIEKNLREESTDEP